MLVESKDETSDLMTMVVMMIMMAMTTMILSSRNEVEVSNFAPSQLEALLLRQSSLGSAQLADSTWQDSVHRFCGSVLAGKSGDETLHQIFNPPLTSNQHLAV